MYNEKKYEINTLKKLIIKNFDTSYISLDQTYVRYT